MFPSMSLFCQQTYNVQKISYDISLSQTHAMIHTHKHTLSLSLSPSSSLPPLLLTYTCKYMYMYAPFWPHTCMYIDYMRQLFFIDLKLTHMSMHATFFSHYYAYTCTYTCIPCTGVVTGYLPDRVGVLPSPCIWLEDRILHFPEIIDCYLSIVETDSHQESILRMNVETHHTASQTKDVSTSMRMHQSMIHKSEKTQEGYLTSYYIECNGGKETENPLIMSTISKDKCYKKLIRKI